MTSPGRGLATGAVVASVMLGGGVAVAASLNAAEASSTSPDQTVGALQVQLAQLQGQTADLNDEVAAASASLSDAQAAREAAAASSARIAWPTGSTAPARPAARTPLHVSTKAAPHKKSVARATTAPKPHATSGASGAATGGDDHEAEGGSDD